MQRLKLKDPKEREKRLGRAALQGCGLTSPAYVYR